ncbi:MAG: hypothetical protein HZC51_12860 [Nitrospirae bacterium]|nr:hypothetical protein [Nitrospirota bacterium]
MKGTGKWAGKCLGCHSELNPIDVRACHLCGYIIDVDLLHPGDKLIYFPSFRELSDLEMEYGFETFNFYPGMVMTYKDNYREGPVNDVRRILVDEVENNAAKTTAMEMEFYEYNFLLKESVSPERHQELVAKYQGYYHNDKYGYFKYRTGDRVIFNPSYLTQVWHKDDPDFSKLKIEEEYTITSTSERKYIRLNNVPMNVYWKDVDEIGITKCTSCRHKVPHDSKTCPHCGVVRKCEALNPGGRFVFLPDDSYIDHIWNYPDSHTFYPGMLVTIKLKVREHGFDKTCITLVEEDPGLVYANHLYLPEFVAPAIRRARMLKYVANRHDFQFFHSELRVGQKVKFRPAFVTKVWHKDNPLFSRLIEGEIYTVTKIMNRRYIWLDDVELDIYWRDVETA